MPIDRPEPGEVWGTQGSNGAPLEAVVISRAGNVIQLISRTGRVVSMPSRSLALTWRFIRVSDTRLCVYQLCERPAYVRNTQYAPYCLEHLPRNGPVLFPGDNPLTIELTLNGDFPACPSCKAVRTLNAAPWQLIENLILHACRCRARWIALTAQGLPTDPITLGEDLLKAHTLIEAQKCSIVEVVAGRSALAILQRAFREGLGNPPSYAGITLCPSDVIGSDVILIQGKVAQEHDEEFTSRDSLASYWQSRANPKQILQVVATQEVEGGERRLDLIDVADRNQVMVLSERLLWANYRLVTNLELVSNEPDASAPAFEMPLKKVQTVEPEDHEPSFGEVWWHADTRTPVQVVGSGIGSGGVRFIRFTVGGDVAVSMLADDFVRFHFFDKQQGVLNTGDEYEDPDGNVYVICALDDQFVTLDTADGVQRLKLTLLRFREASYKKVFRRTALEMLLDNEDLLGDDDSV